MSSDPKHGLDHAAESVRRARSTKTTEIAENCLQAVARAIATTKPARSVQIRRDFTDRPAYIAIDALTGSVLLRHQDNARLRAMCQRLGWRIVDERRRDPTA